MTKQNWLSVRTGNLPKWLDPPQRANRVLSRLQQQLAQRELAKTQEIDTKQEMVIHPQGDDDEQDSSMSSTMPQDATPQISDEEQKICGHCNKTYTGYGHNSKPLNWGSVCGDCNIFVLKARFKNAWQSSNVGGG